MEHWDVVGFLALVEEWDHIDQDYIMKLFESMPHWVQALLEAKGGHTKY